MPNNTINQNLSSIKMISVVIPLYNKEKQIAVTLQKVFEQTYQDFEVVIVDDGSTDNSVSEVNKFRDARVRLISQANAGVAIARNRGIENAKGKYIAFLDADDEWNSKYLEEQIHLINRYPQCDIFASNYIFKHFNGKYENTIIRGIPFNGECGVLSNYFQVASMSHPPLWTSAVVVSKKSILDIGGFPAGIKSGEDILTWARLSCKYKIAFSKKISATYNLGEGYDFKNQPPRKQDKGDPVGKALKELYLQNKSKGLKRYISLWHKMRASVAVRYGDCFETIREGLNSLRYNPLNSKVIPLMILAVMPSCIRNPIIRHAKR